MKSEGVFVQIDKNTTERFVNNEGFEYRARVDGGVLTITQIAKKDAGKIVDSFAAFAEGSWKSYVCELSQ